MRCIDLSSALAGPAWRAEVAVLRLKAAVRARPERKGVFAGSCERPHSAACAGFFPWGHGSARSHRPRETGLRRPVPNADSPRPYFGHAGGGTIGAMTRYAADTIEAVGSAIALVGIPAVAWLGFVGLIEAVTRSLGLL